MVIWGNSMYIVIPLVIGMLGHWSLILQGQFHIQLQSIHDDEIYFLHNLGVLLEASWIEGTGCVITHTNNTILAATFIYSMCFDLTVLILSAIKILSRRGKSQLITLLFKDGLVYFIIA